MGHIKICVIGAGGWGKNHIRTLSELGALGGIVEADSHQRNKMIELYPNVNCLSSIEHAFKNDFDGFVVATPPITHVKLAEQILTKNKPVLVEKPLTLSIDEAQSLKNLVENFNGKLMVGHLLLFHPAIMKMKKMIQDDMLGNLQYIYSNRLNLGVVRKEENVFWSFAPHDLSLFQFFTESFPVNVQSSGGAYIQKNIHDTTMTYLKYPNGIHGHIYVSWLHPFKEHRLVIIGSKGSLHFEDAVEKKPLLYYEKDQNGNSDLSSINNKPSKTIDYESTLPLNNELEYFIDVIKGKTIDKATLNEGIDVVKILEMATNSLSPTSSTFLGGDLEKDK